MKKSTKKTKKVVAKLNSIVSWKTKMQGYFKKEERPEEIARAGWALVEEYFNFRYK